jgi:Helix-turn-helix domain
MENGQTNPLNEILTEQEVLDLLGIKKDFLSRLRREKQFPFCKISETQRVYLARDVVDYIKSKRMVINRHA